MAEHRMQAIVGSSTETVAFKNTAQAEAKSAAEPSPIGALNHLLDAAAAAGAAGSLASPRWPEPEPLSRSFLRCPKHPEEPLQYFCLTCQTACICAECVIHGEHRGHEVLNVREAVRRLPEKVGELATTTRLRAEEISSLAERVNAGRRELASMADKGRKDLRVALEQVSSALQHEEKALLAEVDRCSADAASLLCMEPELHIGQALEELQKHREAGNAAQALTWYAKLKKAVAAPQEQRLDAERVASQLRVQLQKGFANRLAGLAGISSSISELQPPSAAASARRF